MVKKSVISILVLLSVFSFVSCESQKRESTRNLKQIEKTFLDMIPKLQDHAVLISDLNGSRTGMYLAGGLVITSSRDSDHKGNLISLDFTQSQQVQGAVIGKNDQITLIRVVSNLTGLEGVDFSPLIESDGLGLFIAFSDPHAPRPSIRLIRDIKNSDEAFSYDELDDGGAVINMNGDLCAVYSHTQKETIYARQFRSEWNKILGLD